MDIEEIGKIEKIPLRSIWKHEAIDFTKWLQNNSDVISEVIGMQINNLDREKSTGSFNVDLVGEDSTGNTVIIENQLEKSNHDHLGKIITYFSAFDASVAIWIVSDARPEHISAISWLNESTAGKFYLIKVEGIRIGDSKKAPLLTLIVGPSETIVNAGKTKMEKKETKELREKFWTIIIEKSKLLHQLFNAISPSSGPYIGAGAGKTGLSYQFWINKEDSRIQLKIDKGKNKENENLEILNNLMTHKDEIEKEFGEILEWDELPDDRSCCIRKSYKNGGYSSSQDEWINIADNMVQDMSKLEKALAPFIKKLKI